ncbi:MAG: hypothetical protein QXQ43_04525 [Nitrososphaerota archaeon]
MVNEKYYVNIAVTGKNWQEKEKAVTVMIDGLEEMMQFLVELGSGKSIEKCICEIGGEIVEPGNYDDGLNVKLDWFKDSGVAIVNIE